MEKKRRITRESTKNLMVKTGSGAKRIATAPGRKVKQKMDNLNERMVAIEWTPRTMIDEYIRFNITGTFNSIFAYLIYELFYWINLTDAYRSQAAWAACILIGQIECHYAHYRFTFGSAASYLTSLRWAVTIYTTILVLSTITFHLMVTEMEIYHRYAWVINIVLFGFVNFAFLRWLAFPPESDKSHVDSVEEE
tara:strand:- start:57 stop:638 length:582 start_codon:yes stop_codon:yes gene_type:complete